jgi:ADP-heptose:LPS heptosyltransferase
MVSPSLAATGKVERPPVLHFSAAERTAFDERSRGWRSPSEGPWIAVAPGGGNNPKLVMPQKRWPKEQMSELVARLVEREKATVFLLGDRTERALLEGLAERSPHQVVLLAGELSLRETAQLIEKCRLFIGNDSGLLHVSAAVGRPSVSFFGPTSPHGKIPEWVPHRVLYTKEICSPCYRYGSAPPCPYDLRCLRNITVDQAEAQVRELLGSAHG